MRFKFTGDKKLLNQIKYLKKYVSPGQKITMSEVVIDSIQLFYQLNVLMDQGYKIAIIDKNGKKHFIRKKRGKKDEDDE